MFHVERRGETEKHPQDLALPLEIAHRRNRYQLASPIIAIGGSGAIARGV